MVVKSLRIKNHSYYFWDDMVYLKDFDVRNVKVVRQESRIGADIYYIRYIAIKPQYDINSGNPLFLIVKHLLGRIELIPGSSDRYLVFNEDSNDKIKDFWEFIEDEIVKLMKKNYKITFGDANNKVLDWNKIRLSSDADLPVDTTIEFHALTVVINCVIEKDRKCWPEIHLDAGLYETSIV